MANITTRTAEKDDLFFAELAKRGNVSAALRISGYPRNVAYYWKDRDPEFTERWKDACLEAKERLEDEAYRRAHDGIKNTQKLYDRQGKLIEERTTTQYSDTLLIFLLKALDPDKYRESFDIKVKVALDKEIDKALDRLQQGLTPEEYQKVLNLLATDEENVIDSYAIAAASTPAIEGPE